jgi:hypothetical protein
MSIDNIINDEWWSANDMQQAIERKTLVASNQPALQDLQVDVVVNLPPSETSSSSTTTEKSPSVEKITIVDIMNMLDLTKEAQKEYQDQIANNNYDNKKDVSTTLRSAQHDGLVYTRNTKSQVSLRSAQHDLLLLRPNNPM